MTPNKDHPMPFPIAIVGIAAELPGGRYSDTNLDHAAFFEFLMDSGEAYERIPSTRFNIEAWKGNGLGQIAVEKGSFLKDIDLFDHVEFGISSRDAIAMAPVTRKLLESCFLALLDSGIDYRKQLIGCYTSGNCVGGSTDEYGPRGSFAGAPSMVANRLSNHLDLLGPSIPVDTACSSSLTAIHIAVQAILLGDCRAAVVGGCQLNHGLIDWISYSQSALLSGDGKCKPFDVSADGFGRAEGCVAVVIKSLEDALRDHDHVYATILGTSVNSTGSGGPPGAPVAESQSQAMKVAFQRADRNPRDVAYVELHATGTAKGDPTEANWVGQHFQRPNELLIGSVKGNIGHTEIAAFLASLSKVISIFEHKIIPPNVNLSIPNPAIKWSEYNLRVPTLPTPLPAPEPGKTVISMASSGVGGSNGHIVLESPPVATPIDRSGGIMDGPVLLMAAGLSPRSTSAIADQISEIFQTAPRSDYAAASTTLGRRSKQMSWRSYAIMTHGSPVQFSSPQYSGRDVKPLVFIFSGQGPQHERMGQELFSTFPVFRDSILDMDAVFQRKTKKSMIHDYGLFGSASSSFEFPSVWPISLTLPAIAMFQMALFDLLVYLGVAPDIIMGHSAGETAVLYASGAASKAMAFELAIIRGQIFSALEMSGGTMAALSCPAEEADTLLAQYVSNNPDSIVELACLNSPSAVAISGHERSIDAILELAHREGIFARKIRTRVPIHSSMMDVCRDQYNAEVQDLFDRYPGDHFPKICTYSTLTGRSFPGPFDAEYFWMNTRAQVLFAPAVHNLSGASTFVELAPHPVLASYLSDMATRDSSTVISMVQRPRSGAPSTEHQDMLQSLGKLTAAGHNCLNFTLLNSASCSEWKIRIPAYPFLKKRIPLFTETNVAPTYHGPINRSHLKLNGDTHPTLSEHVIRGEPIWPAAGFIEMAFEFGATALFNVNFSAMLPLSAENPVPVDVTLDASYWKVTSSIPARVNKNNTDSHIERVHADGYLSFEVPPLGDSDLNISEIRSRCGSHVDSVYPSLSYFSSYGPQFQRVTNLYYNSNEAIGSIRGMDVSLAKETSYILHPAVLDACLHIATYRPFHGDFAPNNYYLPSRIGEVILHQAPKAGYFPRHVYSHVQLSGWMPDSMHFDVTIVDDYGKRLCTLRNFEVARHQFSPLRELSSPLHMVFQPVFHNPRKLEPQESTTDLNASPIEQDTIGQRYNFICQNGDPGLAAAWMASSRRLRSTISSLIANGCQRVIRIRVFNDVNWYIAGIKDILTEFRHSAFEVYIPESCGSYEDINTPFVIVRHQPNLLDGDSLFDIAVSFGGTTWNGERDPHSLMAAYDTILLPGGTLLLTDYNLDSWDRSLPEPGAFDRPPILDRNECEMILQQMGYFLVHTDYVHPSHFTIDAQKAIWEPKQSDQSTLLDEDAFVFNFVFGDELQLQWEFSGLNPSQELEIWILALEGLDAAAGLCLTRALRREYLFWNIRFVSFPSTFSEEMRLHHLRMLPSCMKDEPDILFSLQGSPRVPRLVPLVAPGHIQTQLHAPLTSDLPPDHAVAQILRASTYPNFSAFIASVVRTDVPGYHPDTLVVGLQHRASESLATIDLGSTCNLPADIPLSAVDRVPGTIISTLGPGLSVWNRPQRMNGLAIFVTHSETIIGSTICEIYQREGIKFVQTRADATMLDLVRLGTRTFDLIISGYEDEMHTQMLRTLLRPSGGKPFLWHLELPKILREDPCSIGDALCAAISRGFLQPPRSTSPEPPLLKADALTSHHNLAAGDGFTAMFDAEKTYVLIGGIGSLGASVAVYMVQRGARHIVATSRSGRKTLLDKKNLIALRMFTYLERIEGLDIRLEAVDGTSLESMGILFDSIDRALGGCLILSGILADGLFPTLGHTEFTTVAAAKTSVLKTLQQTIDVTALEFIIAFSSVTSVVGTGGQTNYCAANGALEEQITALPNGFAFICPGILDSAFMLAEGANGSRLKHLLEWSISTDEMIMWLDDAISKYQYGTRFHRYMPSLNWEILDRTHGMPKLGAHLVHSARDIAPEVHTTTEDIVVKASRIIRNVLNISEDDFDVDVPLTSYGIDSLSAGRLSFALRSMVEVTQLQLLADNSLTDIIRKFPQSCPNGTIVERVELPGTKNMGNHSLMDDLVRKFTDALDRLSINPKSPSLNYSAPSSHTVLLTGSTGALGCHLLGHLLANDQILHVYALNRSSPDGVRLVDRQASALKKQGLSSALAHSEKLSLLVADLGEDDFGMSSESIDELRSSVTHIIHNAWRVDLMSRLQEFENHIVGSHRLLEFAIKSKRSVPPSFSFISTIGVYQTLNPRIPAAPESPILDAAIPSRTGYSESKWVMERLVQIASERRYLNANVIRVGLLTGGPNGSWDTSHWVPALAQSGVHIGCLPDGDDTISWLPIGDAAAAIVDMRNTMNETLHLIHPKPTTWRAIMVPLASAMDVPLVPYAEWFARLKSTVDFTPAQQTSDIMALKLLDFFQRGLKPAANRESMGFLPKVVAHKGARASKALTKEGMLPLNSTDVENWVRYWREVGFLPQ